MEGMVLHGNMIVIYFIEGSKLLSLNIGSLSNWKNRLVTGLEKSNIN